MAPPSRPNIMVIFPDQLRRDALSVYGDPNVATPNIDSLAQNGVRFTQACSTYPVCVLAPAMGFDGLNGARDDAGP